MISLKVNKRKVKVPTSYEELSYKKAMALAQVSDPFDVAVILLELTEEEKKQKFDMFSATIVMKACKFLQEKIPEALVSTKVDFRGEKVNVKDLESLPIGAYKDMQRIAQSKEPMEANQWIVAIYLQTRLDGSYDFEKASFLVEDVGAMSCLDVVGMSSFFFRKLSGLRSGTLKTASLPRLLRWRLLRVLMNWKDLIFLIFYQLYAKTLIQIEKRFLRVTP